MVLRPEKVGLWDKYCLVTKRLVLLGTLLDGDEVTYGLGLCGYLDWQFCFEFSDLVLMRQFICFKSSLCLSTCDGGGDKGSAAAH